MRSDAELLTAYAASGDEAAFAALASRHGAMVYRVCLSALSDPHEAEDASQATFLVLARKARGLRSGTDLAAWLYGTARRVALWAARTRATRRRNEEAAAMAKAAASAAAEHADRAPEAETLYAELDRLPAALRQAVLLRYAEGLSQEEAAAAAGCPQGTLGRRAAEGLERLRARLAQRGAVLGVAAVADLFESQAAAAVPASLLPSILAVPKLAAAGAAAGAAGAVGVVGAQHAVPVQLAEAFMKAMFWMKMKLAAAFLVGAAAVGGGGTAIIIAAAEPAVPKAESPQPAPAEAGKVAWGEAANGLQAGLVPLGGVSAKDWPESFLCAKCREFNRMSVTSKCGDCGAECNSNRKLQLCVSCAAKKRTCQACGAAKPWGATFAEGEPMRLELHARNLTAKPLTLKEASWQGTWLLVLVPAGGKVPRTLRYVSKPVVARDLIVPANGQSMVEADYGNGYRFEHSSPRGAAGEEAKPIYVLPPDKYTVTASYEHAEHAQDKSCSFWHGKVTTGAFEIEIKPKAVESVPVSAAEPLDPGSRPERTANAWQKLFADEGWYKNQAGAEQVFSGTLEGIPVVEGMATTLQRDSYYKLGGRTLYTGAKKLPALDALVGRKVEIRGKPVDMDGLEGQNVREIWPAAVREAGAAAGGGGPVKLDPKQEIKGELPVILPVGPPVQAPVPGMPGKS